MFFVIKENKYKTLEQIKIDVLMSAYFIVKNYPLNADEALLESYIKQHYKISLKNLCINLLLDLKFYKNSADEIIIKFNNPESDKLARLITYGNGVLRGSRIIQLALKVYKEN